MINCVNIYRDKSDFSVSIFNTFSITRLRKELNAHNTRSISLYICWRLRDLIITLYYLLRGLSKWFFSDKNTPWPGIEPGPPEWESGILTPRPSGNDFQFSRLLLILKSLEQWNLTSPYYLVWSKAVVTQLQSKELGPRAVDGVNPEMSFLKVTSSF